MDIKKTNYLFDKLIIINKIYSIKYGDYVRELN